MMNFKTAVFPSVESSNSLLALFFAAVLFFVTPSSYAAGGGGGGGSFSSPSQSAPKFDPVEKYQEGIAALQNGENRKAEKAFRKVIGVNNKHAKSQYFLGLSLFEQEKFKKAKRPFEKALKYDSKLISAHGFLGVVFQETNKPKKVDKHRQALIKLKETCGECKEKSMIDRALQRIEGVKVQSSLDFDASPTKGDQHYLEAVSHINRGDYAAALSLLDDAATVFGPHPDVLTYQGFANRKLGNKEQALSFYQAALKIDSNHRGANEYLGEYYIEIGRLDLAKVQLDKLKSICSFGCEEAEELGRWVESAS